MKTILFSWLWHGQPIRHKTLLFFHQRDQTYSMCRQLHLQHTLPAKINSFLEKSPLLFQDNINMIKKRVRWVFSIQCSMWWHLFHSTNSFLFVWPARTNICITTNGSHGCIDWLFKLTINTNKTKRVRSFFWVNAFWSCFSKLVFLFLDATDHKILEFCNLLEMNNLRIP